MRATLLSGRYPFRHGIGGIIRRSDVNERYEAADTIEFGVGPDNREWTLAHLARAAGHRSFMAGKWHLALLEKNAALGGEPGYGWEHIREQAGFDEYWAVWGNLPGWPQPEEWTDADGVLHRPGYSNYVACADGEVENERGGYVTSEQTDRVLSFVDRREGGPWLVYCAYNAAHSPYQLPPPELVETAELIERGRKERAAARSQANVARSSWPFYLAMVEALDAEIGRLLAGLEERGVLDRTVVFLLADNGTPNTVTRHGIEKEGLPLGELTRRFVQPGGERFKHTVWEPGVRVPLIVSGPVVGEPGRSSDVLVDATDVFETVREILGVELEAAGIPTGHVVDGVSFLPVLRAAEAAAEHPRHFSLVEHFEPNGNPELVEREDGPKNRRHMQRRAFLLETDAGRFKLVRNLDRDSDGKDQLFQLTDGSGEPVDPWELEPLRPKGAPENRARMDEVRAALDALLKSEARNWR
jgi:arylsulfatase A-like enzyme